MDVHTFGAAYADLLHEIHTKGVESTNARTSSKVRTALGTRSFTVNLAHGLQLPGNRAYYPKVAAAELGWMLLGTRDPAFVMKHAPKLWSKFIEDEVIPAAYGYRWRQAFGRDQLAHAVAALKVDPSTRQVWVQAWDPGADGLGYPHQPKNIPCPLGFSLNIIGDKLHMALFIRSSDAYVGLPYDVMVYSMLLALIASTLGVAIGTLHVTLPNVHLYETHWDDVNDDLGRIWHPTYVPFTRLTLEDAARDPELLVAYYNQFKPVELLPRKYPEVIL